MFTIHDERSGLVKTTWNNVRDRVYKVSPEFAKLIDQVSPDNTYYVYLAYYPFGELIGDTISPFMPSSSGSCYRLSDSNAPKDVIKNLGYGKHNAPLAILLEKTLEYFFDIKQINLNIPWKVYSPGAFFPLASFLKNKFNKIYTPNTLLTVVSGARSVFILPKVGSSPNHLSLRRCYNNVKPKPPKDISEHWQVFKDIINSNKKENNWRSCVLYFSRKWVDSIHDDINWILIKNFFLERANSLFEFVKNQMYYNIAYSVFQLSNNLKPNPYLLDTACHLFALGAGVFPGYAPAINDHSIPLTLIQLAYAEAYGLKKYIPTIMQPQHFQFEDVFSKPTYYSLNYPSTLCFSPRSRKDSSTLFEMDELIHIVSMFQKELIFDNNILSDTVISDVAKNVEFHFFHNRNSSHSNIKHSDAILDFDNRFSHQHAKHAHTYASFSSDAPFLRGCVSLSRKNKR